MLSETSLKPRISASIRSSMTLRLTASRSSSSSEPDGRQPAGEVAGHDGARRLGHGVDAAQHAARDEEAAGQPQDDDQRDRPAPGGENDVVEPLALLEIAADQQAEAARQLEHAHQRVMLGAFGIVEPAIDRFGPAGCSSTPSPSRPTLPASPSPLNVGNEIEARARPARARIDDEDEPPDAALGVLLGQAGDFRVDRASDLLGDQPPRVPGEIAEQKRREQREHGEIDQRQLERGGVGELAERAQAAARSAPSARQKRHAAPCVRTRRVRGVFGGRDDIICHGSCIPRRGRCAAAAARSPCRSWSAAARCARR